MTDGRSEQTTLNWDTSRVWRCHLPPPGNNALHGFDCPWGQSQHGRESFASVEEAQSTNPAYVPCRFCRAQLWGRR